MPSIKELSCWEIMNCSDSENCPAMKNPGRSCWDLVKEMDDYRADFNVCADCIVYMVKSNNIVISAQAINEARAEGQMSCALAPRS
jgi:hypothetical protein